MQGDTDSWIGMAKEDPRMLWHRSLNTIAKRLGTPDDAHNVPGFVEEQEERGAKKPSLVPAQKTEETDTKDVQRKQESQPVNPPVQGTPPKKPTPRDYLERIPITGLYNMLYSESRKEWWFWIATLVITAAITVAYLVPVVVQYARFQTVLAVEHKEDEWPVIPPMYVCVSPTLNGTFLFKELIAKVFTKLKDDPRLVRLARIQFNRNRDAFFYEAVAFAISDPTVLEYWDWLYPPTAPALNELLYKLVQAYGSEWPQYKTLYQRAFYTCDNILENCKYNGIEFPCCFDGIYGYPAGNNKCFKMNMSSLFAKGPTRYNKGQVQLSFSVAIDGKDGSDLLGITPRPCLSITKRVPTPFQDLVGLTLERTTRLTIKRKRRVILDKCMDRYRFDLSKHNIRHGDLIQYFANMTDPNQYSVDKCTLAHMFEMLSIQCGCVPCYDTMCPNDTDICTPMHMYACLHQAVKGHVAVSDSGTASNSGQDLGQGKDMFAYLKEKARKHCLPLCDDWEYEAQVTVTELDGVPTKTIGDAYAKVIISLEPEYQLSSDVLKTDFETFLAAIGDQLGLFLGMSFVAFVQAAYWVVAAVLLKKKQETRVQPQVAGTGLGPTARTSTHD